MFIQRNSAANIISHYSYLLSRMLHHFSRPKNKLMEYRSYFRLLLTRPLPTIHDLYKYNKKCHLEGFIAGVEGI